MKGYLTYKKTNSGTVVMLAKTGSGAGGGTTPTGGQARVYPVNP